MTDPKPDQNQNTECSPAQQDQWLAFCYIADELEPEDLATFEERLTHDQSARDAVANAVHQAQVLYSSLNSTSFNEDKEPVALAARHTVNKQRRILRHSKILLASAAALLMLVTGWAWFTNPPVNNAIAENESERLASAWVATLVVMSDDQLNDFIDEELPESESDEDASDDWMLVALASMEDTEGAERETN